MQNAVFNLPFCQWIVSISVWSTPGDKDNKYPSDLSLSCLDTLDTKICVLAAGRKSSRRFQKQKSVNCAVCDKPN